MAANPIVPTPELQVETEPNAAETIVRCRGKINTSTAPQLQTTVRGVIAANKKIVLDLSQVTHMDSSGLGALVGLWVSAKRAGCQMRIVSLSQRVKELLQLTKLDELFAISKFPNPPSS